MMTEPDRPVGFLGLPLTAWVGLLFAAIVTLAVRLAGAAELSVAGPGGSYSVDVTSLAEARFKTVIAQEYDFSCGSAALATLLKHHYETPVDEREVFEAMYQEGDRDQIGRLGFSLMDMKRFLAARGVPSNGYWAPLDRLTTVGVPAIALIDLKGYRHFVVVKGIADGQVLVGDPATGLGVMSVVDFEGMRQGPLFVIESHAHLGRSHFNAAEEWDQQPAAPVTQAVQRTSLALAGLMLRAPNEF